MCPFPCGIVLLSLFRGSALEDGQRFLALEGVLFPGYTQGEACRLTPGGNERPVISKNSFLGPVAQVIPLMENLHFEQAYEPL